MTKYFSLQQPKLTSLKAIPGLFILDEEAIPPGISNTALNCYANSVFQCLFSHNAFITLAKDIIDEHERVHFDQFLIQGNVAFCKEYINITIINAIPHVRIQIVLLKF